MSQALTVEIWSDLICPWCWIGKRRFEQALAAFAQRDQVKIVHRAFRLMPGVVPQPARNVLLQKLGTQQRMAAALAHVEAEAAKEGLTYHLADAWAGDTLDLHRLVKYAASQARAGDVVERLYRAVFTETDNVFDHQTQLRLLTEIGLPRADVEAVLAGDTYGAEVAEDQRALQARGGNGVPFFVIAGSHAISGGQPAEVFARALQQAWDALPIEVDEGLICGPDGCAVPAPQRKG